MYFVAYSILKSRMQADLIGIDEQIKKDNLVTCMSLPYEIQFGTLIDADKSN